MAYLSCLGRVLFIKTSGLWNLVPIVGYDLPCGVQKLLYIYKGLGESIHAVVLEEC